MDDRKNICANGYEDHFIKSFPDRYIMPVLESEIEIAQEYIKTTLENSKKTRYSSYHLKHAAEQQLGAYISNGAFIVAATREGFRVERIGTGPNAWIYAKLK